MTKHTSTSTQKMSHDHLDGFEEALHLEDTQIQAGKSEGRAKGVQVGHEEGFELGKLKAFEIGGEVGRVAGSVAYFKWKLDSLETQGCDPKRLKKAIESIESILSQFKQVSVADEQLQDKLEALRAKNKVLLAIVGETTKIDNAIDTSF